MINKPLKDISQDDLLWMVTNQIPEDKTLEFKSVLNLCNEDGWKKLLNEIAAFANTDGGDLIYGIREVDKVAAEVVSVAKRSEYDGILLKINDLMASKIRPRINSFEIRGIDLEDDNIALVIRVESSLFSPHAVFDGATYRFYLRRSNSILPMDVDELRNGFLQSDRFSEKIRNFISERLGEIDSNRYGYVNKENPIVVVHAIPVNRFLKRDLFSLKAVDDAVRQSDSSAFRFTKERRLSFDGVRLSGKKWDDGDQSYAFYFLDGTVEIAGQTGFFSIQEEKINCIPLGTRVIRSAAVCIRMLGCFQEIRDFYQCLNMSQPVLFFMSILNARGYYIDSGYSSTYGICENSFDRDVDILPDIYVDGFSEMNDSEVSKNVVKPLLDSFWNAGGLERCFLLNEDGSYNDPANYK